MNTQVGDLLVPPPTAKVCAISMQQYACAYNLSLPLTCAKCLVLFKWIAKVKHTHPIALLEIVLVLDL